MEKKFIVSRIVSGGQTGADRGGLDAAIELGIPYIYTSVSKMTGEWFPVPALIP